MGEEGSEEKSNPLVVGNEHQQELSSRLHYASGFGERLFDPRAIQMIDRIATDDCVEAGGLERELAHVAGFDRDALLYTRGL